MGRLSLNCDLGENEPLVHTEALLKLVDAANICCGVHAGSADKTLKTLTLAKELGVLVGAHPGMATAGGRGLALPDAKGFQELLKYQLRGFYDAAQQVGVELNHIKLHGNLYVAVEKDSKLAEIYLQELTAFPGVKVFALSGGSFTKLAAEHGVKTCAEVFADRGYLPSGGLIPRSKPGAVLSSVDEAVTRIHRWLESGEMQVASGGSVSLKGDTVCVHSDSANALELLRALREL